MRARSTMPDVASVKTAFVMRADQIETIDRLAKAADLNRSQALRRLVDLGIRQWTESAAARRI